MKFTELGLTPPVLKAVQDAGYHTPSPIQAQTIPHTMAGKDIMGCAQTGTGKTAAFALPILHRLNTGPQIKKPKHAPRCLVLAPTRELAIQIEESFTVYGSNVPTRTVVVFGGVHQNKQVKAIQQGVDVLVATPGRLMDLHEQGLVDLSHVQSFILDEADRMLDMGFIHDIRKIAKHLPRKRQTLMFSATMPKEIEALARDLLYKPTKIETERISSPAETVEQLLYYVDKPQKVAVLAHLLNTMPVVRAIVFSRTKHGADRIVRLLKRHGVQATAIHGNKSQNQRQRSLALFKDNKVHVLVATDIAARGIDIDDVSHVFNYDVTHEPETYVHRIGRTGRAGQSGVAVSLCTDEEIPNLKAIEKLTGTRLRKMKDLPDALKQGASPAASPKTGRRPSDGRPGPKHTSAQPVPPETPETPGAPRAPRAPGPPGSPRQRPRKKSRKKKNAANKPQAGQTSGQTGQTGFKKSKKKNNNAQKHAGHHGGNQPRTPKKRSRRGPGKKPR